MEQQGFGMVALDNIYNGAAEEAQQQRNDLEKADGRPVERNKYIAFVVETVPQSSDGIVAGYTSVEPSVGAPCAKIRWREQLAAARDSQNACCLALVLPQTVVPWLA